MRMHTTNWQTHGTIDWNWTKQNSVWWKVTIPRQQLDFFAEIQKKKETISKTVSSPSRNLTRLRSNWFKVIQRWYGRMARTLSNFRLPFCPRTSKDVKKEKKRGSIVFFGAAIGRLPTRPDRKQIGTEPARWEDEKRNAPTEIETSQPLSMTGSQPERQSARKTTPPVRTRKRNSGWPTSARVTSPRANGRLTCRPAVNIECGRVENANGNRWKPKKGAKHVGRKKSRRPSQRRKDASGCALIGSGIFVTSLAANERSDCNFQR